MKQISKEELVKWQEDGKEFQLIDVRETHEHQDFNIGGELIPLSELTRQFHRINPHAPVVFYCRKGIRSQIAIQRLKQRFPHAQFYNLTSGISK